MGKNWGRIGQPQLFERDRYRMVPVASRNFGASLKNACRKLENFRRHALEEADFFVLHFPECTFHFYDFYVDIEYFSLVDIDDKNCLGKPDFLFSFFQPTGFFVPKHTSREKWRDFLQVLVKKIPNFNEEKLKSRRPMGTSWVSYLKGYPVFRGGFMVHWWNTHSKTFFSIFPSCLEKKKKSIFPSAHFIISSRSSNVTSTYMFYIS